MLFRVCVPLSDSAELIVKIESVMVFWLVDTGATVFCLSKAFCEVFEKSDPTMFVIGIEGKPQLCHFSVPLLVKTSPVHVFLFFFCCHPIPRFPLGEIFIKRNWMQHFHALHKIWYATLQYKPPWSQPQKFRNLWMTYRQTYGLPIRTKLAW